MRTRFDLSPFWKVNAAVPRPSTAPLLPLRVLVLVVVGALSAALVATGLLPATAAPGPTGPSATAAGRTWVVDAVDDATGNRWESVDTGTSEVVVEIGDTVEWQFDRAAQEHDLTSLDTGDAWTDGVAEYRLPQGPPVRRTFTEPGTYYFTCSIHGTLMHGRVVVLADGANRPPAVTTTVEPLVGPAPLDVHATAVASDPDDDPLTYRWDFGDADAPATTAHAMYRYDTPGSYTVTLEVSDGRGGTHTDTFAVTVGAESAVTATATPTMGAAPLVVDFVGGAAEEGATYSWDFGDGAVGTGRAPEHTYSEPGTYTATVTASGAAGELGSDTIDVMVTESDLPAVVARATPTGALGVALTAEVTTTGSFAPFADGVATYPALTGAARLVRSRGSSYASLDVTGLKAGAPHNVHVHEKACGTENAGAHFRFDETKPFAEPNEIWLPFTSDAQGASGLVEETQPVRAGVRAVSIVVHDPDNPAKRIGCADLGPSTADLAYAWDFGDGTTGSGPDPDHTYAAPGTYTATVTVSSVHAGHGGPVGSRTASAQVTVAGLPDTTAPQTAIGAGPRGTVASDRARFRLTATETATFACRLDGAPWLSCPPDGAFRDLTDGRHRLQVRATDAAGNADATPAARTWSVDTAGPVVRRTSATTTADRTPDVAASVTDRLSKVRSVVVRIDGRAALTRYDARTGRLTGLPARPLAVGRHAVRLVATDAVGNRSITTWRLRVRS
jgi:PKD repeat protein